MRNAKCHSSDNNSKAVEYLGRAGQQAMRHSAHLEAIKYLQLGLDFLMKLPETRERERQEIALQAALGPWLMEARGYSPPEVEAVYGRIAELGERTGRVQYIFGAQGGLFLSYMVRAIRHRARNYGWFTEGFEIADLREARQLLEQLGA